MKYENYPKAKDLYEKIKKAEELLDDVSASTYVSLNTQTNYSVLDLFRDENKQDNEELAKLTKQFYSDVKNVLISDIQEMKKELEKL